MGIWTRNRNQALYWLILAGLIIFTFALFTWLSIARYRGYNKLLIAATFFTFALLTTRPNVFTLLFRNESDTMALSEYVAVNTNRDDIVLSDYAGINFFANRESIYEASIIAGGRIGGDVITTDMLLDRIESDGVVMVLVHVAGGEPAPHQLVALEDYNSFHSYLEQNFELLTTFDRAGQQIEVFARK